MSNTNPQKVHLVYHDGARLNPAVVDADGNVHVEVTNTDPIPITIEGGTSEISEPVGYVNVTGTGDSTVVSASATLKTRIHYVLISNNSIPCKLSMRFGAGSYQWNVYLPSKGSVVELYWSPAVKSSAVNEAFLAKSSVATVDVDVTAHYEYVA
jgi:hypothetical protein